MASNWEDLASIGMVETERQKTGKAGIKNKRLRAGQDMDYLLHLLGLMQCNRLRK